MKIRAMSGQKFADPIEARFGLGGDVGLQLRGEPLTDLKLAPERIVIVVRPAGLLR